jgi:hypothetical protein
LLLCEVFVFEIVALRGCNETLAESYDIWDSRGLRFPNARGMSTVGIADGARPLMSSAALFDAVQFDAAR